METWTSRYTTREIIEMSVSLIFYFAHKVSSSLDEAAFTNMLFHHKANNFITCCTWSYKGYTLTDML